MYFMVVTGNELLNQGIWYLLRLTFWSARIDQVFTIARAQQLVAANTNPTMVAIVDVHTPLDDTEKRSSDTVAARDLIQTLTKPGVWIETVFSTDDDLTSLDDYTGSNQHRYGPDCIKAVMASLHHNRKHWDRLYT